MQERGEHLVYAAELDISGLVLGDSKQEFVLETREDVVNVAHAFAAQARRTLFLHTADLESRVFDQSPFLDAVSEMVRNHAHAHFWVLVQDARTAIQSGHRLVELSRRLGSSIQLRKPHKDYCGISETFLLADDTGYLHRPLASRYEGTANFNDRGRTLELKKYFLEVWERSEPDMETRRLYL